MPYDGCFVWFRGNHQVDEVRNLGRLRMSGTPSDSVLVDVRKLFLERRDLRKVVDHDVGLIRMLLEVALVILLGAVKSTELRSLRYDRARKGFRRRQLLDVVLGDLLLLGISKENR